MLFKNHKLSNLNFALILALLSGMFSTIPVRSVRAAPLTVTNTNDSGAGSLRQTIADAVSGDTITFDAALAGQTITLTSTLVIDRNLTIDGSTLASKIIISGNNSVRVFYVNPDITVTIDALIIRNGSSTYYGGGIHNRGILTVLNSTFSENRVSGNDAQTKGGAIANYEGVLSVSNSIFSANSAEYDLDAVGGGYGGAIYSLFGELTVTDSIFDGNLGSRGGAIVCEVGTMTVTDSAFLSNSAISLAAADGGAIFQYCNLTIIVNSTFSDNSATLGGAIHTDDNVNSLIVVNSTFHSNMASTAGGGIVNYGGLIVVNSTFSDNTSPSGGAINNGLGGNLSLRNSILANSVGGVDCIRSDGTPAFENINNLIETTGTDLESCGVSHISSDPILGPLANNGGFTNTMALLPGSPAIDAGNEANCPDFDQRGVARPQGTSCDIGAYEYDSADIQVNIAGNIVEDYELPPQSSIRDSYPSVDNGPVKVSSTNSIDILTALRVIWKEPGFRASYSEMMGLPAEQLSTEYWFPWYNNAVPASMDQGFRIGNVNSTSTAIQVWVGNSLLDSFTLNPGASTRVSYNVDNGPIRILCTNCSGSEKIIAALRVIWKEPGVRYSYSEMMGLPKEQLSSEYWFPWYNNAVPASMDQGFRIANVSSTESNTVEVWVGTTKLDSITLGAGASTRVGYSVDNGPIKILCTTCTNTGDDKIIAALRVIWKEPGFRASYSEMMGLPKEQLSDEYWFPWYNNAVPASMDQGFRIANISSIASNNIEVWVGSTQLATLSLSAGASTRVGYNADNGPIRIVCTSCTNTNNDQILAALRVIWKEPGFRASYSEMMGLPAEALSTEYWFPWYNFAAPNSMDQGFRIAVP